MKRSAHVLAHGPEAINVGFEKKYMMLLYGIIVGGLKIRKYAYLCIFRLTTS